MFNPSGRVVHELGLVAVVLGYIAYFWRVFRSNSGNKLVECGTITLIVFVAMLLLFQVDNVPVWLLAPLMILLALLCMSTLYFVAQRGYQALRRRSSSAR